MANKKYQVLCIYRFRTLNQDLVYRWFTTGTNTAQLHLSFLTPNPKNCCSPSWIFRMSFVTAYNIWDHMYRCFTLSRLNNLLAPYSSFTLSSFSRTYGSEDLRSPIQVSKLPTNQLNVYTHIYIMTLCHSLPVHKGLVHRLFPFPFTWHGMSPKCQWNQSCQIWWARRACCAGRYLNTYQDAESWIYIKYGYGLITGRLVF